jgi:hypothetical protein
VFKKYQSLEDVYAQRAGRVAFGLVLGAGALLLAFVTPSLHNDDSATKHAVDIILGSWLFALAAAVAVYSLARTFARPRSGHALRTEALAAPGVGLALMLPITLHLFAFGDMGRRFDDWVYWSVLFTSHTHIVFALLVASRAISLANGEKPVSVGTIYAVVCGVALIPIGVPIVYVAITGIPIVPLLVWMERIARIDLERSHEVPFAIARVA